MASPRRVAVAASAGRDSTALLHCTLRAAAPLGIEVLALHVHHGLMADADTWLRQVREQARRWGAGFDSRHLSGRPAPGESVEAWARDGRYCALAEMAHDAACPLVLLAHHRRDQAETWLLQALRGAGPAGLSAMPVQALRGGITWARPWLALPREAIEAYGRRHRLRHADDPSNAARDLARGRLRRAVWPALSAAFPQAEQTLAAAAARAQQAARLAEEVAALDATGVIASGSLGIAPWMALPPARRRNLLRAWLADATGQLPPETLLTRLDAELPLPHARRWPAPGGELHRHRARLHFTAALLAAAGGVPRIAPR